MQLTSQRYADVVVVSASGRVDHRTVGDFETALDPFVADCADGKPALVLDLGGVDYMSSVGLRALMLASRRVRRQNGRLAVCCLGDTLAEIFAISRFDQVFDVHADTDAALAALSPQAAAARRDGV